MKARRRTIDSGRQRARALNARLKASPAKGGPIRTIRPSGLRLGKLRPVATAVTIESHVIPRGQLAHNPANGLPGFRWDVPLPDPQRTVLWMTLGFDWAFYGWKSDLPRNTSN